MNKLSRVGIDLAKNVYQLHGVDRHDQAIWRRRLTRNKWMKVLLETIEPGCEVGMEACAGGNFHFCVRSPIQLTAAKIEESSNPSRVILTP